MFGQFLFTKHIPIPSFVWLNYLFKNQNQEKKNQPTKWDTSGFSIQYSRDIDEHGETQVIKIQKVGGVYSTSICLNVSEQFSPHLPPVRCSPQGEYKVPNS